jgi:hypothetical protein
MLRPRLPPELVQHVLQVGHLSKKDLSLISTVSCLFRDEAQRVLFRDPGRFYLGLVEDSPRAEAFFNAIISSPSRLALMVRVYSQNTQWYDTLDKSPNDYEPIFNKMTEAFKLMDNVKRFQSSDRAFTGHFRDRLLGTLSQAFPRLEEFSWHYNNEEQGIIDLLANRHGIRYVELPDIIDLGNYDHQERERLLLAARASCLKLEALSGTIETTKILIPGKSNIRYLRWTRQPFKEIKYETDMEKILDETGGLQYLEYEKCQPDSGIPFQIIAPHLRELVFLRVCNRVLTSVRVRLFALFHTPQVSSHHIG